MSINKIDSDSSSSDGRILAIAKSKEGIIDADTINGSEPEYYADEDYLSDNLDTHNTIVNTWISKPVNTLSVYSGSIKYTSSPFTTINNFGSEHTGTSWEFSTVPSFSILTVPTSRNDNANLLEYMPILSLGITYYVRSRHHSNGMVSPYSDTQSIVSNNSSKYYIDIPNIISMSSNNNNVGIHISKPTYILENSAAVPKLYYRIDGSDGGESYPVDSLLDYVANINTNGEDTDVLLWYSSNGYVISNKVLVKLRPTDSGMGIGHQVTTKPIGSVSVIHNERIAISITNDYIIDNAIMPGLLMMTDRVTGVTKKLYGDHNSSTYIGQTLAKTDNYLYIIGGVDTANNLSMKFSRIPMSKDDDIVNVSPATVESLTDMPHDNSISPIAGVFDNNKIVVYSGSKVSIYDESDSSWKNTFNRYHNLLSNKLVRCSDHCLVYISEAGTSMSPVIVSIDDNNDIREVVGKELNLSLADFSFVSLEDGRVAIIGGRVISNNTLINNTYNHNVYVYNTGSDEWITVEDKVIDIRHADATLMTDGRILLVGGGRHAPDMDDTETVFRYSHSITIRI